MRGVLITGGESAIGVAIARAFARRGDTVYGTGLATSDDSAYAGFRTADLTDSATAHAAVTAALGALGRLDVVVLAAARMPVGPAASTSDDDWHTGLNGTLSTAFYVARAALPALPPGGAIVAVSSVNAFLAAPGVPVYAAAKAGLEGLIRQLALEYGPRGIRVNAVAPGLIGGERLAHAADGYPLGRTGRPEDVAEAVAYLASDLAGFITGVTLPVDGGLSIASPAAYLRPDLRERFL